MAAVVALRIWPDTKHRVFFPSDQKWNEGLRDIWALEFRPVPGSYMDRNDALVAACDILIAFPPNPVEQVRSGTWATVRRGRAAGKKVIIYPLNGE